MAADAPIRFATIGLNHGHIYGQTEIMLRAGAELVSVYAEETELLQGYRQRYPQAETAAAVDAILDDPAIDLVISASIPNERAPLGIRVMEAGKDFMADKPGITSLDQLADVRRVQAATGRIYSICYSERLEVRSAVKAGELVRVGAIGDVLQVLITAPHHERPHTRPAWFYDPATYGGIITDIGSHQYDQILHYTGASAGIAGTLDHTDIEIVSAQVANYRHGDQPKFEDFGDAIVRGSGWTSYMRVDWFTPEGLGTWGDGRVTILGTDGYIELRKYVDIAGRPGGNHLFLVDHNETRYIDCSDVALPYGRQLVDDIRNRTETAMSQAHCFLAMELALRVQAASERLGYLAA